MNNQYVAIISHPDCLRHNMGIGHPESPQRISVIEEALKNSNISALLQFYQAKPATFAELKRVHDSSYINSLFEKLPKEGTFHLDPDTIMCPFTLQAALLAAGAVIQAVDCTMQTNVKQVFCNIRPPGHHAEHDRAMGFCFFNNIAIGVAHALEQYSFKRVAIVDFDVHHGNGTENIFQKEDRVLLLSSYQHPFYPFNKVTENNPHILHMPLLTGSTGKDYKQKVANEWLPVLADFSPELLFISAGFDAHADDPLAGLHFHEEDYYWITQQLLAIAKQFCHDRVVSVLEGGYNLQALQRCVLAHIHALLNKTFNITKS